MNEHYICRKVYLKNINACKLDLMVLLIKLISVMWYFCVNYKFTPLL